MNNIQITENINRLIGPFATIAGLALTASALIINNVSAKKEHFIEIITGTTWLFFTFFFALMAVGYCLLINLIINDSVFGISALVSAYAIATAALALIGRLVKQLSVITKKQYAHNKLFQNFLNQEINLWDSIATSDATNQLMEKLIDKIDPGKRLQHLFSNDVETKAEITKSEYNYLYDYNLVKIEKIISHLNDEANLQYNLLYLINSRTNGLRFISNKTGLEKVITDLKNCVYPITKTNAPTENTHSTNIYNEWKECLKSNEEIEIEQFINYYEGCIAEYQSIVKSIDFHQNEPVWQLPIAGVVYRHLRFGIIEMIKNTNNCETAIRSVIQFIGTMANKSIRSNDERIHQLFIGCINDNIPVILNSQLNSSRLFFSILFEEYHRRDAGSWLGKASTNTVSACEKDYTLRKYSYFISLFRFIPFYGRYDLWQETAKNFEITKKRNAAQSLPYIHLLQSLQNSKDEEYHNKRESFESEHYESILLFDISVVSRSWLLYFLLLNKIDLQECKKLMAVIQQPNTPLPIRLRQLDRLIDIAKGDYLNLEDWDIVERNSTGVYSPPSPRDWLIHLFCSELMANPEFECDNLSHENTQRTQNIFEKVITTLGENKTQKGRLYEYILSTYSLTNEDWDNRYEKLRRSIAKQKIDFELNEIKLINTTPINQEMILIHKQELSSAFSSNSLFSIFDNFNLINSKPIDSKPSLTYFLPKRFFQNQNSNIYVGQTDHANQLGREFEDTFYSLIQDTVQIIQIKASRMIQVFEQIYNHFSSLGLCPSIFLLSNEFYFYNNKFEGLIDPYLVHHINHTINSSFHWNGIPIVIDNHNKFTGAKIIAIDLVQAVQIEQVTSNVDDFKNTFPISIKEMTRAEATNEYLQRSDFYFENFEYPISQDHKIEFIMSQVKVDCFADTEIKIVRPEAIHVSEIVFID